MDESPPRAPPHGASLGRSVEEAWMRFVALGMASARAGSGYPVACNTMSGGEFVVDRLGRLQAVMRHLPRADGWPSVRAASAIEQALLHAALERGEVEVMLQTRADPCSPLVSLHRATGQRLSAQTPESTDQGPRAAAPPAGRIKALEPRGSG